VLFQVWIKAKNVSDNPVNFVKNVYDIVCNSVAFIAILFLLTLLPLSMIVIGFIYKDQCLIQPNIPIWLIVFGSLGVLNGICRLITSIYVLSK
jgi:hypothetical protein